MEYGELERNAAGADVWKTNDLIYEMPVGVAVARGGHELYLEMVNRQFLHDTGYSQEELIGSGKAFEDYVYGKDLSRFEDAIVSCREKRTTETMELRMRGRDGGVRWKMMQCRLYYYRDAVPYYILTSWDINERKGLEEELRLMDEQYRMLEEVTDEFPFEYDVKHARFRVPQKYHVNGKVRDENRKYMSFEEMLEDIHEEDRGAYSDALQTASVEQTTGSVDYRLNVAAEGEEPRYVWYRTIYRSILGDNGQIIRIIGRSYDVSSDRKIQEELSEEMRLDPLTRVLNKVAAGEEIDQYLSKEPEGTQVMFLIDIDDFKRINDTFGHTVGDTVISDIAEVIRHQFRGTDIVARVGGDEFLAFMKQTTLEAAEKKAAQLCKEAAKRLIGDDAIVNVTLSIGISVYGADGRDYETLFAMSDRAMYDTKRNGKNSFSFARKDILEDEGIRRQQKSIDNDPNAGREVDKDFLNLAFSLLAHARDINGSLNVLIEQIGKKYGLDFVTVFEYMEDEQEMLLMNSWNSFGRSYEHHVFQRTIGAFEEAETGEFVDVEEKDVPKECTAFGMWERAEAGIRHLGGIKFEFSGNRTGFMCVGMHREDGGFRQDEASTFCELCRVVGVFVSLRNKQSDDQREIQHLQDQDMLTGLYNLEAFRRRTKKRMKDGTLFREDADGKRYVYALVHLDVNNFSYVNENFGQKVGDNILGELGRLLVSEEHVVEACRMYSDYFVELVRGESEEDVYRKVLEEDKTFEKQQKIRYPASTMRLSAGICFIGSAKESFDTILEGANLARKQAKEQKIGAVIYREDMREKRDDEIHITGRFYGALQKGELELYLQPKFLLKERRIYGAEALARWRTESGNVLSPVRFIPPLENMGYVVDLDFFILEQLLRAMRRWQEAGKELFTISTNFSRRNFENGGDAFIARLEETMSRYQIDPKYIEIEVTESVIVENLDGLKDCLGKLEALGYRIAIDDFGTGYSSLSVLLEIPANVVKIDKSFTDRINLAEQQEFVSQMGQFIRSAKEEVIFEGIEENEQREFLIRCGFDYGQGYYFDRPLPLEEFEKKYI